MGYHRPMARAQTMVQLSDELLELLDAEAARLGVSRSALVREAVATYLAKSREASLVKKIVDGYKRIPPVSPDAWGDLDNLQDRATGELLSRLDEEERQAGREPW